MKTIFLDVDGVLNCDETDDVIFGYMGIEYCAVKMLREIVEETDAQIVLCSSWKEDWYKDEKDKQDRLANYLDKRLAEEGLTIVDKTVDKVWNRGEGIINYLKEHPEITTWIILDDEIYDDYEETGCLQHLVQTAWYDGGLKEVHVAKAIEKLNDTK
jgi:hypothetical protein